MRSIKLLAVSASLLLGACGTLPQAPATTVAADAPAPSHCLRETGSRIKPRDGECLSVNGRAYTNEQVRGTGAMNTGEALYRLGL